MNAINDISSIVLTMDEAVMIHERPITVCSSEAITGSHSQSGAQRDHYYSRLKTCPNVYSGRTARAL